MRGFWVICLGLWPLFGWADGDKAEMRIIEPGTAATTSEVWMGVLVASIPEEMQPHLPQISPGMGFLVTGVAPGGPGAKAGIKVYDVLWKLEDQKLCNRAQLGTLLRQYQPGDTVHMSLFRSGMEKQVELVLYRMPQGQKLSEMSAGEVPLFPSGVPGMPKTVVYPEPQIAELTREDGGTARMVPGEDGYHVEIRDKNGKFVFQGELGKENTAKIPEEWKCVVETLRRALNSSETKPAQPVRRVEGVQMPPKQAGG